MRASLVRRAAAVLLLAGLVLPYSCDARPITVLWSSWDDLATLFTVGIPVLVALAYGLHRLVPALARFHERNGAALHGLFRAVFFLLAGAYLMRGLERRDKDFPSWLISLLFCGGLLVWQQQRGTKAQRLPLLLLTIVGLPALYYASALVPDGGMQYGGWVFTLGYVAAVAAEVVALRAAPPVTHGG
jgi:hypothetical protein